MTAAAATVEALAPALPAPVRIDGIDGVEAFVFGSREEWLAGRLLGVGGSDAAAVMGLSPWKSAYELYCEKAGLIEPADLSDNEAVKWGTKLEPMIAEEYQAQTKRTVHRLPPWTILRNPAKPHLLASLDGLIVEAPDVSYEGKGVLEIKAVGAQKSDDWSEGAPLHYLAQCQLYLAVTGLRWASFGVLIGGQKFQFVDVERVPEFVEELDLACADFVRRVQEKDPPPMDDSASTARALKKLYPKDNGETVALPESAAALVRDWLAAKEDEAEAKERKERLDTELRGLIGGATFGTVPGLAGKLTLKTTERGSYTVEATSFRSLRYHEKKSRGKR